MILLISQLKMLIIDVLFIIANLTQLIYYKNLFLKIVVIYKKILYWIFSLFKTVFFLLVCLVYTKYPVNISMLDQGCFNVVDQRWNNVDPTLKMKRQCPTLKQRLNNVAKRWYKLKLYCHKSILNPIRLVMIMDL